VLESWTKKKIFGLRTGEEIGDGKKLHEELQAVFSAGSVLRSYRRTHSEDATE
jgi:hypothetical protein